MKEMMEILGSRLRVEIALPGAIYRGSRYDWSGFITQVTLDDCHTFCGAESLAPGSGDGGLGLCNEFGIFTPIGYDSAAPGELFPKLGVGLLARPDDTEYQFSRPYAVEPFPVHVAQTHDALHIVTEPVSCRGLAARLEKTIRVEEDQIIIAYLLQNVGTEPFHTEEYAHNYLSIDGLRIGPDYTFALPPEVGSLLFADQIRKAAKGIPPILERRSPTDAEQEVWLTRPPTAAFYLRAASQEIDREALAPAGSWWQLTNGVSGAGLRETTDFGWGNFALYGTGHALCPEIFLHLNLLPGQERAWSRRFTFFTHSTVSHKGYSNGS